MKYLSNNDFQENLLANVPDGSDPKHAVNKRQLDVKVTGEGIQTLTVSENSPTTPLDGDLWIDSGDESYAEISNAERMKLAGIETGASANYIACGLVSVNSTGLVNISGLGFRPRYIEFEGIITSSDSSASYSSGYYDGTIQYAMCTTSRQDANGNNSYSRYYENSCLRIIAHSSGLTTTARIDAVSINSDGFTVNCTTASANATVRYKAHR